MERDPALATVDEARASVRAPLDHGAPWDACDAFASAVVHHPDDAMLLHLGALAHARAGATGTARDLLVHAERAAVGSPDVLVDVLSLRGRLSKDRVHRATDSARAVSDTVSARDAYLAAHAIAGDAYPAVNAATLSALMGDAAAARRLAGAALARVRSAPSPSPLWDLATAGEAHLLLGELDDAMRAYGAARDAAAGDAGTIATMRRQLALLARVLPDARAVLATLRAADVVAFSGHLVDLPGRGRPRFPASLEPDVRVALHERLREFHAPVVYTSAACGADLVFIEAALELGAEINIVLPFDRDDFVRTSVAVGGAGWVDRFDRALARAAHVLYATDDAHLGDDALYEYAARMLEGLAVLRADRLQTRASLLCVLDPDETGETHSAVERWRARIGPPVVVDLKALRQTHASTPAVAATRTDPPIVSRPVSDPPARPHRSIRTMLFADFTGYSRLKDEGAPRFQAAFWRIAAAEIARSRAPPLFANTWGDAIYVVVDEPRDGAELALRLVEAMRDVDWSAFGLPQASNLRVALHTGPVFHGRDPIMEQDNYFGANVTRAARVEPITPPGMVYATESFAALLAIDGGDEFVLEYMGLLALAKGYATTRIYRLDRP